MANSQYWNTILVPVVDGFDQFAVTITVIHDDYLWILYFPFRTNGQIRLEFLVRIIRSDLVL